MRAGSRQSRTLFLTIAAILVLCTGTVLAQDAPPPKPKPKPQTQEKKPVPKPPPRDTRPKPPPAPVLLASADRDCRIELDGEVIGELKKDVVERIEIQPGEHLLQAFPLDLVGPVWKESLKAPDTGTVVATIELQELVEEWEEAMQNVDRFSESGNTVRDNDEGLVWAKNVGPEMNWEQAATFCGRQQLGGLKGWRLPTVAELSTLYFEDHEEPTQEPCRGAPQPKLFGSKKGEIEVLPRMIFEPFEHNSLCSLWVQSSSPPDLTACSFLGSFGCDFVKKKHTAGVLCVAPSVGPN